jgi:hypothetical protein
VESNAAVKVKDVGERIRHFPSFRQAWLNVQMLIAGQQSIEEKLANPLRLRIKTNAWVEIRGTALDDHDKSVRIDGVRARESCKQG